MKKLYEEPELQIRSYSLPQNGIVMTSGEFGSIGDGGDLNDGDDYFV